MFSVEKQQWFLYISDLTSPPSPSLRLRTRPRPNGRGLQTHEKPCPLGRGSASENVETPLGQETSNHIWFLNREDGKVVAHMGNMDENGASSSGCI